MFKSRRIYFRNTKLFFLLKDTTGTIMYKSAEEKTVYNLMITVGAQNSFQLLRNCSSNLVRNGIHLQTINCFTKKTANSIALTNIWGSTFESKINFNIRTLQRNPNNILK